MASRKTVLKIERLRIMENDANYLRKRTSGGRMAMSGGRLALRSAIVFLMALAAATCSKAPEDGLPGSCSIDCSKAVIGSSTYKIVRLSADQEIECTGGFASGIAARALSGPVTVHFKVEEEVNLGPGRTEKRSVPYISVDPVIEGMRYPQGTHPDNATVTTVSEGVYTVDPYRYAGVVTRKSEWCSDSCGVVTLEVYPVCVKGATNNVSVSVRSGAAMSEPATYKITNGDE